METRKGQMGLGLVLGVMMLIIGVIIAFVVITSVNSANLISDTVDTASVTNEAGYINQTGYTLTKSTLSGFTLGTVAISNTTSGQTITSGNYTISSGVLTNATTRVWSTVKINYTYTFTYNSAEENATNFLSGNLSSSIQENAGKIATSITIVFVVILLGFLLYLVAKSREMNFGNSGSL